MNLVDIKRIGLRKEATPGRIYIDENGNKYIGTKDNRIEPFFEDGNLIKQVQELTKNKIHIGTEPPINPHEGKLWID